MIINKRLIIFLLSIFPLFSFSQKNNYLKYKYYKVNSINNQNDKISSEVKDFFNNGINDTITFELTIKDKKATFLPLKKLNNNQNNNFNIIDALVQSIGEFYYDSNDGVILNKKESLGEKFIVKSMFEENNWIFLDEIDTINNFICNKAILKKKQKDELKNIEREYTTTVWYTKDVPMQEAPFGLTGLKNLIVKVNFNGFAESVLYFIGEKKISESIEPFSKGRFITKKEYDEILKNYMIKRREMYGGKVDTD